MEIGKKAEAPAYDYHQYDQIWQRVAPDLNPYPEVRAAMATDMSAGMTPAAGGATENLPGAEANPCCMGTAAMEELEVLKGFIEGELSDRRYYLCFARRASGAYARQILRETAMDEGMHARHLMAVYYLITGTCYVPAMPVGGVTLPTYCQALRDRYHEEICGNFNYIRAAEETTDYCLSQIFKQLAADEYHHAQQMLLLLEQCMRPLA